MDAGNVQPQGWASTGRYPFVASYLTLNFHGVGPQPATSDPATAAMWLSEDAFTAVLDEIGDRDDIRLTFDDGLSSDAEVALPHLQARGLQATFFVLAGRIGAPGHLSEEQVGTLHRAGMEIGSHGLDHRSWRGLDQEDLERELVESRRTLSRVTDSVVAECAAPFGAYDRRALAAARRAGYLRFFTSDRGWARADSWLQPRASLHADQPVAELRRLLLRSSRDRLTGRVKRTIKAWR
jgi:peptidoglycan/xylan/chitin deacetylase (PgdA/CDA1 family)